MESYQTNTQGPDSNHKRITAVIILLVIANAIGFYGYYTVKHRAAPGERELQVVIRANSATTFPAQLVNFSKKTSAPLLITGQAEGTTVVDAIMSSTSIMYLLKDEAAGTTNLFEKNTISGKTDVLTNSKTLKYSLSYDPTSHSVAFVEQKNTTATPTIVLYQQTQKKLQTVATGTAPTLLPGTGVILFTRGTEIVSKRFSDNTEYSLLNIATGTPVAIDTTARMVTIYDSARKVLDHFAFANGLTSSYVSSEPISNSPLGLAYVKGELVTIEISKVGGAVEVRYINSSLSFMELATDLSKLLTSGFSANTFYE